MAFASIGAGPHSSRDIKTVSDMRRDKIPHLKNKHDIKIRVVKSDGEMSEVCDVFGLHDVDIFSKLITVLITNSLATVVVLNGRHGS